MTDKAKNLLDKLQAQLDAAQKTAANLANELVGHNAPADDPAPEGPGNNH